MNDLDSKLREQFEALTNRLSPENLACDGECSRSQVQSRYRQIMKEWAVLERKAGRKVTQEEIEEEQYKKWRRSNDWKAAQELQEVGEILAGDLGKGDFTSLASLMKNTGVGKNKAFVDGICKWLENHNSKFNEDIFRQSVGAIVAEDTGIKIPEPVDIGMGFKVRSYPDGMIGIVRKDKTVLLLEKDQAQRLKRLL